VTYRGLDIGGGCASGHPRVKTLSGGGSPSAKPHFAELLVPSGNAKDSTGPRAQGVKARLARHAYGGLALLALVCSFAFAYWPVFRHWWHEWMRAGGYYSHGPLVAAVALWLAYTRGRDSLLESPQPSDAQRRARFPALVGGALLLSGLLLYVISLRVESDLVASYSIFPVVAGIFAVITGRPAGRSMLLPLGLLVFAIPLPGFVCDELTFPFQDISTRMAGAGLWALGQHPQAYGTYLVMPHFEMQVTTQCSGMKTALGLLSLAAIALLLIRRPAWQKLLLFVVAVPAGLLLNAARLTLVGLAGNLWGEQVGEVFHNWAAFAVLAAALLCAAALVRTWRATAWKRAAW